jgi:hypothetical protein
MSKRVFVSGPKRQLGDLVQALLSKQQTCNLCAEYSKGRSTIQQLSQAKGIPPLLVYGVVTPRHIALQYKLNGIPIEHRVNELWKRGASMDEMLERLQLPADIIHQYSFGRFSTSTIAKCKWYNERYQIYTTSDIMVYSAKTLPPTSRLGWTDTGLHEMDGGTIGRCEICGRRVYLPCLACRLEADMEVRTLPRSLEYDDPVEDNNTLLFK